MAEILLATFSTSKYRRKPDLPKVLKEIEGDIDADILELPYCFEDAANELTAVVAAAKLATVIVVDKSKHRDLASAPYRAFLEEKAINWREQVVRDASGSSKIGRIQKKAPRALKTTVERRPIFDAIAEKTLSPRTGFSWTPGGGIGNFACYKLLLSAQEGMLPEVPEIGFVQFDPCESEYIQHVTRTIVRIAAAQPVS